MVLFVETLRRGDVKTAKLGVILFVFTNARSACLNISTF